MLKIFPSKFYFTRDEERHYVEWMHGKTKSFVFLIGIFIAVFLISFTLGDSYRIGDSNSFNYIVVLRGLMLLISVGIALLFQRIQPSSAHKLLFGGIASIIVLLSFDLYFWIGVVKSYDPAEEMFSMYFFMVVPFLNVEHKLLLGIEFICGIIASSIVTGVGGVHWTVIYTGLIFAISMIVYYRFDILLRTQFQALLEERAKSYIDPLTGAYNRQALHSYFKDDLAALDSKTTMAVGILDIDCFKLYNDTYGHLAGDKVLHKISQALQSMGFDKVYRFGGEEFVFTWKIPVEEDIVLPEICLIIENYRIAHKSSRVIPFVTVSAGVVMVDYSKIANNLIDNSFTDIILMKADDNLYKAKNNGRNQMVISKSIDISK